MNIKKLHSLLNNKTLKQTFFLFTVQIFGMLMGFASNIFLAKEMGTNNFGLYSFAVAVITFCAIFFEFGFFSSVSRLLAINHDKKKEKEIIGSSVIILGIIFILFFFFILILSCFIDLIFIDKIGNILYMISVVAWCFAIPFYLELILKGSNNIEYLSLFNFLWKSLFALFLVVLYFWEKVIPLYTLHALSFACIFSFANILIKIKPSFKNFKKNFLNIYQEFKVFGCHIYTGRIASVATFQLDKLLIGYVVGVKDVGFYSLANAMVNPIIFFSTSLSNSKYKDFSNSKSISVNIIKINISWILFAFFFTNFLGYVIIHYYLGKDYHDVLILLFIMSLALSIKANYQPYMAWLNSNGYGPEIKVLCIKAGIVNILVMTILINTLGTIGAALASLISVAYIHFSFYKLYNIKKQVFP